MSLIGLSVQGMVMISSAWIDPSRDRPLLEKRRALAGLVPKIEEVHARLVATQRKESAATQKLAIVQERQAEADAIYDRKARGLHSLLSGLAELADDESESATYEVARDQLFPEGLRVTKRSYWDEAGDATLVEARLTPPSKKLLAKIPIPHGVLSDEVEAWLGAGRALGELEVKRRKVSGELPTSNAAETARARNAWIQMARTIEATLAFDEADEATASAVLGALREEEAKADRRASRRASTTEDAEAGAVNGGAGAEEPGAQVGSTPVPALPLESDSIAPV